MIKMKRGDVKMKLSRLHVPTLKQVGLDTEFESFKLMMRAGLVRRLEHGLYTYLPLGSQLKNQLKKEIENLFFEESLNAFELPIAIGKSSLLKSRDQAVKQMLYKTDGPELYLLSDWKEEQIIEAVKSDIKSYKQLPFSFLAKSKQPGKRDKIKENPFEAFEQEHFYFTYLRAAEESLEELELELQQQMEELLKGYGIVGNWVDMDVDGYELIKTRGFYIQVQEGGQAIYTCTEGHICADEKLTPVIITESAPTGQKEMQEIFTPDTRTIEELESFLHISGESFIKSLIYNVNGEFIMVEVPGNRDVDEYKLARYLGKPLNQLKLAEAADVMRITGAEVGFAGPIGLKENIRKIGDQSIANIENGVVGANKTDYHIQNVNFERDFNCELAEDLLEIKEGDVCGVCHQKLEAFSAVKIAEIRICSEEFIKEVGLHYLDENGKQQQGQMIMLDIQIDSLLAMVLEKNRDEKGFVLNRKISPYDAEIIIVNTKDELQREKAMALYEKLLKQGYTVLIDERNERPGIKFTDAELLGIPYRITVGKGITEGIVELVKRSLGEKEEIPFEKVLDYLS